MFGQSYPFLLLPLLLSPAVQLVSGAWLFYNFEVGNKHIAPDGFTRSATLVNRQFPGPVLTAQKGDYVFVNVVNTLDDPSMRRSTSVHWHGIFQPRKNEYDGVSFVTQCPIAPDHSFLYRLDLGQQAGTFWYHSHRETQYADGLRGPLIIYDPDDPQKYLYDVDDASTIITLADWYHTSAKTELEEFLGGAPEPVPESGLINGKGRYNSGPRIEWPRINVVPGKRYRFRVMNIGAEGEFDFQIANHLMTVIEADGVAHQPYTVDAIAILCGQRYSVIVAANRPVDNYWVRATQTVLGVTQLPGFPEFNGTNNWAVLHYKGAPAAEPTAPKPPFPLIGGVQFQENKLVPLADAAPPGGSGPADQTFHFSFDYANPNGDVWLINGIQYTSPSVPTLLHILANGYVNQTQFAKNESTFVLKRDAVVELVLNGGPKHPFHLHGHTFSVIQSAGGGGPNYENPPRRDTIASGFGPENAEPVRIRFKTDNSGAWLFHCHIDWHFATGMAVVFAEDPTGIESGPQSIRPQGQWEELCDIYNNLPPDLQ